MNAHTPGPWRYIDGYFDCEVWAGNKKVLSYERHPTDEDRANARLMAAAPELLEALEACLMVLNANDYEGAVKKIARAAIASATEAV